MPAKTKKQERFMQAVAHSPKFAKKVGVPMSVGKEMTAKPMRKSGGGTVQLSPREQERRRQGMERSTLTTKEKIDTGMFGRDKATGLPLGPMEPLPPEMAASAPPAPAKAPPAPAKAPPRPRAAPMKKARGGSVDRIGRAVEPSRRDPDIGKLIKEQRVPTAGAGSGMGRMQKARRVR